MINEIDIFYSAAGTKLAEIVMPDNGPSVRRDYIGRFELTGDSIAKILFPTGFITPADTTLHTFITDYQGNIAGVYSPVTNSLEQFTDYYPYGLPHASATSPEFNRRKYGGKELTTDLGQNIYDFAARWQNPAFPAFTTLDPLAEKYYPISPYAYCAGDPINLIDPSGKDIYKVNLKGEILERIECSEYDCIQLADNDGNDRVDGNGEPLCFDMEYGTIELQRTIQIDSKDTYDVYQIKGDENGTKLFEFLSDNLCNHIDGTEFALVRTGKEGPTGLNFITTSHGIREEKGASLLLRYQLRFCYYIREHIHSHPINITPSMSDYYVADYFNEYHYFKSFIPTYNYHVPTKMYYKFFSTN